jgi:predicted amidohydrolase
MEADLIRPAGPSRHGNAPDAAAMATPDPAVSAPAPEFVSLELWAANLETGTPDLASWLVRLEQHMAAAAARGSQLLALPEFACAQWLSFAPLDLPPSGQLGWLAEIAVTAMPAMASLATTYGVSLLPGTVPERVGARDGVPTFANRAWLLTPEGGAFSQDKLSLTPIEEDAAAGATIRGERVNVIPWNGLRVAIAVCLDVEYTALWARLGQLDLDLVLVPAKTDMITGYNRVFTCARARAIELQTAVCAVGAVGAPLGHPATDTGVGGAAAFLPSDVSLHLDGVFAALPPQSAALVTDPVLVVQNLPVGQCRRIRNGAAEAEVCPAAWTAEHLHIG